LGKALEYKKDGNDGKPLGMSEAVENWRDGMRQHASKAYDLSGVDIMYNNIVHRITIEGKKATGVESVGVATIIARREVILTAGAYRTPQAL
jgi:choline dehydrogenase-like flavoprotein